VDYWCLGNNYEDEYFITVKKDACEKLFGEYNISNNNRTDLLNALLNTFKGASSFRNIEHFLKLKGISFENKVRHDER